MSPTPFHIMSKPIGPRCNIDCNYCYYLEKEKLFPAEKKFRMPLDILDSYIRQLIENSVEAGMREVPFVWQGGEPTMLGIEFFKSIVKLQQKYAPSGIKVTNALQTNGILLDDAWGAFSRRMAFSLEYQSTDPKRFMTGTASTVQDARPLRRS